MNEEDYIKFVQRAGPSEWNDYAREIKDSLDILWKERDRFLKVSSRRNQILKKPTISRTWLLLASFSIENLLKGILIYENPNYISNGSLSKKVSHHRLSVLTEEIDSISLTDDELEVIEVLESCLPYWGRYPIPKKAHEIENEIVASSDFKSIFEFLFNRLDKHIYDSIKYGWEGPHNCEFLGSIRSEYEDLPENYQSIDFHELFKWRKEHGQ